MSTDFRFFLKPAVNTYHSYNGRHENTKMHQEHYVRCSMNIVRQPEKWVKCSPNTKKRGFAMNKAHNEAERRKCGKNLKKVICNMTIIL